MRGYTVVEAEELERAGRLLMSLLPVDYAEHAASGYDLGEVEDALPEAAEFVVLLGIRVPDPVRAEVAKVCRRFPGPSTDQALRLVARAPRAAAA